MKEKDDFQISEESGLIPNLGLGEFIVGYRNYCPKPSRWWLALALVMAVAMNFCLISEEPAQRIGAIFIGILLAGLLVLYFYNLNNSRKDRDYIFVFQKGFVWETRASDDEFDVRSRDTIWFGTMRELLIVKTPLARQDGSDGGIFSLWKVPTIVIYGLNGQELFVKQVKGFNMKDPDKGTNGRDRGICAIDKCWSEWVMDRYRDELHYEGMATFGNIQVGKSTFTVDGKEYLNDVAYMTWTREFVIFKPKQSEKSPYYSKSFNPTGGYAVSIINLPNLTAFLMTLEYLFPSYQGKIHIVGD